MCRGPPARTIAFVAVMACGAFGGGVPAEVVVASDDVVFAQVPSHLDLDHFEPHLARIAQPMPGALGDARGLVLGKRACVSPQITSAVPCMTTRYSERSRCICSDSLAPGFTVMRLTR